MLTFFCLPTLLHFFITAQLYDLSQLYSTHNMSTLYSCNLLCSTLLYSTLLCSALPCCSLLYSTVLCCSVLYSSLLYSTLLDPTLSYSTLPYSTLLHSTLLYCTLLYSTPLYSPLLYSTLLYSPLLYSTPLYTLLSSTVLYSTGRAHDVGTQLRNKNSLTLVFYYYFSLFLEPIVVKLCRIKLQSMCTQESEIFGQKNIYLKNKNRIVKMRLQKSTVFPPFFDQSTFF